MTLVIFGHGYTSRIFAEHVRGRFDRIVGTARRPAAGVHDGVERLRFENDGYDERLPAILAEADAVLCSVPPDALGDPVLEMFGDTLAGASRLEWIGYLSSTGVYGDHQGAWVDETADLRAVEERSVRRIEAEQSWLDFGQDTGKCVQIFRLAGIYGPTRNPLTQLAEGTARRIMKQGQFFSRIHVEDIARVLEASLARPRPEAIYNVADDEPAPPQDVIAFAASLLGMEPPPETPFDQAHLSPMAASFYAENKRVSNRLIREELGVELAYPTYREGLRALHAAGEGVQAA
jgi:nucleoside-diphosphate-sugar epimerase